MLAKVRGYKSINGNTLNHVNERFEYFQNYWQSLNPKHEAIFFEKNRFESHRSLLRKIELQMKDSNWKYSFSNFRYLFLDNPMFQSSNPICKNVYVQRKYQAVLSIISSGRTSKERKNAYLGNKSIMEKNIAAISNKLLDRNNYAELIVKHLQKSLQKNKPLNQKDFMDLKFLINALFMELFFLGYSLDYILSVPDILLLNSSIDEFPFEKGRFEFDSAETFEAYKKSEYCSMNSEKQLKGLLNLVTKTVPKGYIIFEVKNIDMFDLDPIKIGNCIFYNPKKTPQFNLSKKESFTFKNKHVELFANNYGLGDADYGSTCNVMMPLEQIRAKRNNSNLIVHAAYQEARNAFSIFVNLLNKFSFEKYQSGLSFPKHIILKENKTIYEFQFAALYSENRRASLDSLAEMKNHFEAELAKINSLNLNSAIGIKLFNIMSQCSELENRNETFNFKDLWISWESLVSKNDLIDIAKKCHRIKYKRSYLGNLIIYFKILFSDHYGTNRDNYYFLNSKQLEELGLVFDFEKRISSSKFRKNFHRLTEFVPSHFMHYLVQKIDDFINNEALILNKVEIWCEEMMKEVYMERNMEVHKNYKNDLSMIHLKEFFVQTSKLMSNSLIDCIDKRSPNNIEKAIQKLQRLS
jgi:hypothetical protein